MKNKKTHIETIHPFHDQSVTWKTFWSHQTPKVDKRKYSYNEIKQKPRFDFGENDD